MEMYKDIEINDTRYRVGRMTARVGSWVLLQIFTKLLPAQIESQLGLDSLPPGRSEMSEAEFMNIQDHCLMVCRRYETQSNNDEVAMPVMAAPGVFAVKELEHDIVTAIGLTAHALLFNVAPFFEGNALTSILESFKDLNLFKAGQ